MKTVFYSRKSHNRTALRNLFFRGASGISAFGKMPPNILFCIVFLTLPMVGWGGLFWGKVAVFDFGSKSKK